MSELTRDLLQTNAVPNNPIFKLIIRKSSKYFNETISLHATSLQAETGAKRSNKTIQSRLGYLRAIKLCAKFVVNITAYKINVETCLKEAG